MDYSIKTLTSEEKVTLTLRSLYEQFGYQRFHMGRFEEYDFYTHHKNFLPTSQFITFSDVDGTLLALKPDITLSIVKNANCDGINPEKLYYTENVYRISREAGEFREIFQIGIEWLGKLTSYSPVELTALAAKSLEQISENWVLELSHLGFITGLLEAVGVQSENSGKLMQYIDEKNPHELKRMADSIGVSSWGIDRLNSLMMLSGDPDKVLLQARELVASKKMEEALDELQLIVNSLKNTPEAKGLRIDFSIVADMGYYNGLMLGGYVEGVPDSVLVGGRYDNLLCKMNKKDTGAMGFAIRFDEISRLMADKTQDFADVAIIADQNENPADIYKVVCDFTSKGLKVITREENKNINAKKIYTLKKNQLTEVKE